MKNFARPLDAGQEKVYSLWYKIGTDITMKNLLSSLDLFSRSSDSSLLCDYSGVAGEARLT